ncbi:MAG: glutamine--fructose-6-phosphate aminotransferase [isomerizing] [Rhodomicrobium sp.]|nr:MAG: glutamine--fructose-6-phosphate aminotransferase [isomerizing] [Rhodomicrobium sp.]
MCGIVGIIGTEPVAERLVDALKRLEYRGYDSAGVATIHNHVLDRRRAKGKLKELEKRLHTEPLEGMIGIGHTRWATHGKPTEVNAHPHISGGVSVVHNGIIENFKTLRAELEADGYVFETETDTEVIAHLIAREMTRGAEPQQAVQTSLTHLEGAFALAVIFAGHEDLMIGARRGSPFAIGYGNDEEPGMYIGSDAIALAPFTNKISYLEDGDWVVLTKNSAAIYDEDGAEVSRKISLSQAGALIVDKGNHRHFMAKEIHEQPDVISRTLSHYIDLGAERVDFSELDIDFKTLPRLTVSACGTAYYAGLVGKYLIERWGGLPVDVDIASEFRYREPLMADGGAALFISQSGETADSLASLSYCKSKAQKIISIVNVQESSIARESDEVLPTLAGPEIGVASTKAFTCQLTVLAALAIHIGVQRGVINEALEKELVRSLVEVPRLISEVLSHESDIDDLSSQLSHAKDVLYLGRGVSFPIALEGALKLKEISYIHAEAYAAGELKHGPIALIDETMPVIVVAPEDDLFDKTISNMQEVAARGGRIIFISDADGEAAGCELSSMIKLPKAHTFVSPLISAIPVQLLAYYTAVHMGTDVDQPRNLAKSVTVE